jgi:hypothetical protein
VANVCGYRHGAAHKIAPDRYETTLGTALYAFNAILVTKCTTVLARHAHSDPGPNGVSVCGKLVNLEDKAPIHAMERLGDIYKDISKMKFSGSHSYFSTSYKILTRHVSKFTSSSLHLLP